MAEPTTLETVREAAGGRIERARVFLSEVRNELKRVTWPSQKEVYATTIVVILVSRVLRSLSVRPRRRHRRGGDVDFPAVWCIGMTEVATKNWYIVHTYSGFEKKVAESLQQRVQSYGLQAEIGEILIPTEDVVEMRAGKKVVTAKRFFPGYILVEMNMSDHAWHVVKNTPKVTGFVGAGAEADAAQQGRSRSDPRAGQVGGREAQAEVHVRKGRAGADQRGAVHQLQRRGRRREPRQEHVEGDGDDFWTVDSGGARLLQVEKI